MNNYTVRLKTTVYYDVEIEGYDESHAEEMAVEKFADLIDPVKLPSPLEFDVIEAWEIEAL